MEGPTACGNVRIDQNRLIFAVAFVLGSGKQPHGRPDRRLHRLRIFLQQEISHSSQLRNLCNLRMGFYFGKLLVQRSIEI